MINKQIIGNTRRTRKPVEDLTAEVIAAANSYMPPKASQTSSKRTIETKVESIPLTGKLLFITDENLYKEISKYIKTEHPNLENPLTFDEKEGIMKQSNPYVATAVDMYLNKINSEYRLATQLDLEQDRDFTNGTYNDSGLALRNLTNTNSEQAQHLFKQLERRGIKVEDMPLWLNLRGLELDNNLNFNLTDKSFYQKAEQLNWESGTKFSKINDFGLPQEKDDSGSRQIWINENALASCYLNSFSSLGSDISDLSNSSDKGRVVLAKLRSG